MSDSESESEGRCSTPEYKKKRCESSKSVARRKQKYRVEWEQDSRFKGWLVKCIGKISQITLFLVLYERQFFRQHKG